MDANSYRSISLAEWIRNDYRSIAEIYKPIDSFIDDSRFDYFLEWVDGLGNARSLYFANDNGEQFHLIEYLDGRGPITAIHTLNQDLPSRLSELDRILSFLNLERADLGYVAEK